MTGELAELDPFFIPGTARQPKPEKKRPEDYSHEEKQKFYSGLVHIARERRYQSGWYKNQYRERFGVWPRGLYEIPVRPDLDVLAFERHQRIKYAKSREAQRV